MLCSSCCCFHPITPISRPRKVGSGCPSLSVERFHQHDPDCPFVARAGSAGAAPSRADSLSISQDRWTDGRYWDCVHDLGDCCWRCRRSQTQQVLTRYGRDKIANRSSLHRSPSHQNGLHDILGFSLGCKASCFRNCSSPTPCLPRHPGVHFAARTDSLHPGLLLPQASR